MPFCLEEMTDATREWEEHTSDLHLCKLDPHLAKLKKLTQNWYHLLHRRHILSLIVKLSFLHVLTRPSQFSECLGDACAQTVGKLSTFQQKLLWMCMGCCESRWRKWNTEELREHHCSPYFSCSANAQAGKKIKYNENVVLWQCWYRWQKASIEARKVRYEKG